MKHCYPSDVQFYSDYYRFGMLMPGRNGGGNYTFGFQGQLQDNEIKGKGNSVNYKYRMHDPRLGRFFALYPLSSSYPWNSPYAFSENRVLDGVELEGLEWSSVASWDPLSGGFVVTNTVKIKVTLDSDLPDIIEDKDLETYKTIIKASTEQYLKRTTGDYITKVEFDDNATIEIKLVKMKVEFNEDGSMSGTAGYTHGGTNTQENTIDVAITIGFNFVDLVSMGRTAAHELGHSAGLKHPYHGAKETDIGVVNIPYRLDWTDNLMNSGSGSDNPEKSDYNPYKNTSGTDISTQQMQAITKTIESETSETP